MNQKDSAASADTYLSRLRTALAGLPAPEVEEILREFHSHILEREEANQSNLQGIFGKLGSPEDIAALYRTDALVARARLTFSPLLMLRAASRVATKSFLGFVSLMIALFGYLTGAAFLWCAVMKPIWPQRIGLWVSDHRFSMGDMVDRGAHAQELLGWWIIPIGLVCGVVLILLTTLLLRWLLRFALPPRAARFVRVS
jgi:uncharacterized membrane protein